MVILAAIASMILVGCGSANDGQYVLHYSTYSNATSDQSKTAQRFAKEVEKLTDGGVSFRFHYSQSLVNADETVQAVLDGRADTGQVGSLYSASDLAMFTVIELPFETRNPHAQWKAIVRLYEENETYRSDFERLGVRLLFPLPTGINVIGLKSPATSVSDLQGRSIRGGGLTSEVLLAAGANPVAMTATDIYESMQRGVVSGYSALAVANLPTFGLSKVTPYLVEPGIGAYTSSIVVINERLFQSMPPDYQEAIIQASEKALGFAAEEMDVIGDQACKDLRDSGTEFTSFDEGEVSEWQKTAGIDQLWVSRYEQRGYDSQSVLTDYRRIIAEEEEKSEYRDPLVACLEGAE